MIYFIFLCLIHSDKPLKQKNIKLILRFNKVFRSNPIVRDFKRFNIKNDSLSSNHFTLTKNDFDDIILDEKALCLIFNNLDLLSKNDKLKDVYIDKIAIFKENKDPWMKLTFKNNIDSTGYFRGEHTEKFNLEESMFFHLDDIDDETKRKNVINIKKILFYIALLKNKPLYKIYKEDCHMDAIDLVIFKNLYNFKHSDDLKVCVCRDIECTICEGIYDTKRSVLYI